MARRGRRQVGGEARLRALVPEEKAALGRADVIPQDHLFGPLPQELGAVGDSQRSALTLQQNIATHLLHQIGIVTPSWVQMQLVQGEGNADSPTSTCLSPITHPDPADSLHAPKSIWGRD
jgi:hypothetical protein